MSARSADSPRRDWRDSPGRKPPAAPGRADQGVVAGMVVQVGHKRVEDHAPEQFVHIDLGLVRDPAQHVGELEVGPLPPVEDGLVEAEECMGAEVEPPRLALVCRTGLHLPTISMDDIMSCERCSASDAPGHLRETDPRGCSLSKIEATLEAGVQP